MSGDKVSQMSLRYIAGYSFLLFSSLVRRVLNQFYLLVSLTEQFAVIVWTPREIERYSRTDWNSREQVRNYARLDDWLCATEQALVEKYFSKNGELLDVACGAGREALLLSRRGMKVTACDWSPRMIAEAQRRAREANVPVRFAVADLYDLPYPEKAFDCLFLTNNAYSYVCPRRRRIRLLKQAYSILRPGGVFIISFVAALGGFPGQRISQRLFMKLKRSALFNRDYEPGDRFLYSFVHVFQPEELRQEFDEAKFLVKEWLWKPGYAVLTKAT